MPKIISAFNGESPIGDTIAKLGASMFGGPTTDNALKNEQLYALQRENTERDNYAKMIANGGIMPTANNPIAQAMIIAAGLDPRNSAYLGRMDAATRYGADDQRTGDWQVASGDPYTSTAAAFNKNLAEETRNHNLQSGDRRFAVTTGDATDRFKHTTLSAQDEALNNWRKYNTDESQMTERDKAAKALVETTRAHNQQSVDRRYGVDEAQETIRTAPTPVYDPLNKKNTFYPRDQISVAGVDPILSETEQKAQILRENFDNLGALDANQRQVIDANPTADRLGTPKNYILPGGQTIITNDGVTDARTGLALPPGGYLGTVQGSATDTGVTKAIATELQGDTIANKRFDFLIQKAEALTNDPTLFGPEGYVRSTMQEIGEGLKGVSKLIDPDPAKAAAEVNAARAEAQRFGLDIPALYDPRLSEVETIWGLLVYQGASALAGQHGRDVSNTDVKKMEAILGSPQALFSSANSMKSKLKLAREVVAGYDAVAREALDGVAPVTSPFNSTQPVTEGVTKTGNKFRVLD